MAVCTLGTLYGWEPFVLINHHPGKFAGHRHCSSRDINIPANTLILPQMWDIRYCIWPLTFAIIIFCKAHDMSCATRASNNNVRNNFYRNVFYYVQWNKSDLVRSEQGNTDIPYSWRPYTGIYGILFKTSAIVYLPVFSLNTGKYGTKNVCIHDNFM